MVSVSEYTLEIKGLPKEFDNMRIAHLSDLHGTEPDFIFSELERTKPDLVACTGDIYDGVRFAQKTTQLIAHLQEFGDVYFVSGNHEYYAGDWENKKEKLIGMGVHVLDNKTEMIERNGAKIEICGIEDPDLNKNWSYAKRLEQFNENLEAIPSCSNYTRIFLNHRADLFEELPHDFADVVLSGHMHGGHWRIFHHGLIGPNNGDRREIFPKYTSGIYQRDDMQMVVSRGLGDQIKIPRLFNPPEFVWVILKTKP